MDVPLIINPCIEVFKSAQASKGCSDVKNEDEISFSPLKLVSIP